MRVANYSPELLDRLCWEGEVTWGRLSRSNGNGSSTSGRGSLTRVTPITLALRESLDWLLEQPLSDDSHLSGGCREVLELLTRRGASFTTDIIAATRRLPSDVEDILWQLAAAGRVTSDGMEALRRRVRGSDSAAPARRSSRSKRAAPRRRGGFSRWSVLEPQAPLEDPSEERARQLLTRYGVLFPELLARESLAPPWREMVRLLRRMEARGEIRGGRFVSGFVGEQFALPEAVALLRSLRHAEAEGDDGDAVRGGPAEPGGDPLAGRARGRPWSGQPSNVPRRRAGQVRGRRRPCGCGSDRLLARMARRWRKR